MGKSVETTTAIKKAVIAAMETADIPEITVSQICTDCGIARSTFYRYFNSVDEVVKKIGDELLASIRRLSTNDKYERTVRNADKLTPIQSDLARARVLYEYRTYIIAVTGIHGDPTFAFKAVNTFRELLIQNVLSHYKRAPYDDFVMEFFLAGSFRLIDYWLREHPEMAPEEFYGLQCEAFKSFSKLL